ncbi:MAG: response regulator transcription factor [Bacteroidia bacterium]
MKIPNDTNVEKIKKIVILDNHPIFLRGLEDVLFGSAKVQVVKSFSATKDFWKFLAKKAVDMVLVDLRLTDAIGFQVLKQIKTTYPEIKVLVLSSLKDAFSIKGVLALGGDGYVFKEEPLVHLYKAIHNVLSGETYVPQVYLKQLAKKETDERFFMPKAMSPQELVVFGMICDGLTTKGIAAALSISPYTVNNHRKSIIKKTGCKTAIDLFKYAVTHDLLVTA